MLQIGSRCGYYTVSFAQETFETTELDETAKAEAATVRDCVEE